jgi:hypothetical protein
MQSWDLGPWWLFECGSGLNRVSLSRSREWLEGVAKFLHYLMRNDKRQGSSSLYWLWSEDGSERLQKVKKYELNWPLLFTGSHRERLDNFGRFSVWFLCNAMKHAKCWRFVTRWMAFETRLWKCESGGVRHIGYQSAPNHSLPHHQQWKRLYLSRSFLLYHSIGSYFIVHVLYIDYLTLIPKL